MQITYELTEKDFVEAFYTHSHHGPSSRWGRPILFWCVVLVLFAFIFYAVTTRSSFSLSSYLPLLGLAITWFVVIRWLQHSGMKRQFRKQPGAQGPRTVTFDAEGVHCRWDGGSADETWKNYIWWAEGKHQILLYTSPASFEILPTRGLEPEQAAELREKLKDKIRNSR